MWLLTLAHGSTYGITDTVVEFKPRSHAEWVTAVGQTLRKRKITASWRDPASGSVTPLVADGDGLLLSGLQQPALAGLWMALSGSLEPGSEHDLVLGSGDEMRPVTVWLESKTSLVVSMGTAVPPLPTGDPPMDGIVTGHGLAGAREDGAVFEPRVRAVIDVSLAQLSPVERAAMADVTLVRVAGKAPGTHGQWVNTAEFRSRTDHGEMAFFDDLLRPTGLFMGPVLAPIHPAHGTVLHEVAHAVDNAPLRARMRAYNLASTEYNRRVEASNAEGKALSKMPDRSRPADRLAAHEAEATALNAVYAALQEERVVVEAIRPVSDGFRARFGDITRYGATADAEAFAEAFALFHVDRDALTRVSPEAVAWFAAGAHLAGFAEAGLGGP